MVQPMPLPVLVDDVELVELVEPVEPVAPPAEPVEPVELVLDDEDDALCPLLSPPPKP